MLIGEAPGADEDKIGKPFVGQAGQLLDKMFDCINLNRKKNFYITNLVFWRPPGNRKPNKHEISTCLPLTKKHIGIINPKLLILLGNVASQSILSSNEGINILRKKENYFIDKELNLTIPVKEIFHPAYLLINPIEKKTMWNDLLDIDEFISNNNIIKMKSFISLNISIFIISDTRNERSDRSGKILEENLKKSGHKLAEKLFIEDEEKLILKHLKNSIKKKKS